MLLYFPHGRPARYTEPSVPTLHFPSLSRTQNARNDLLRAGIGPGLIRLPRQREGVVEAGVAAWHPAEHGTPLVRSPRISPVHTDAPVVAWSCNFGPSSTPVMAGPLVLQVACTMSKSVGCSGAMASARPLRWLFAVGVVAHHVPSSSLRSISTSLTRFRCADQLLIVTPHWLEIDRRWRQRVV
jgi:hypothetical protein